MRATRLIALFACLLALAAAPVSAQVLLRAPKPAQLPAPDAAYENVHVRRLGGDSLSTQFLITIREQVPAHYHAAHSEVVEVKAGRGMMRLGAETFEVRPGDLVFIPKGTIHSVKVTKGPLKVLSIQSPAFDGTDRVPVEE